MRAVPLRVKQKKGTVNVTRERRSRKDPQGYYIEADYPVSLQEDARDIWDSDFPKVNMLEILREEDLNLFAAYCNAMHHYRDALSQFNGEYLVEGAKGGLVRNPILLVIRDALKDATDLAKLFHITPIVRATANLKTPAEGEGDSDDEFGDI